MTEFNFTEKYRNANASESATETYTHPISTVPSPLTAIPTNIMDNKDDMIEKVTVKNEHINRNIHSNPLKQDHQFQNSTLKDKIYFIISWIFITLFIVICLVLAIFYCFGKRKGYKILLHRNNNNNIVNKVDTNVLKKRYCCIFINMNESEAHSSDERKPPNRLRRRRKVGEGSIGTLTSNDGYDTTDVSTTSEVHCNEVGEKAIIGFIQTNKTICTLNILLMPLRYDEKCCLKCNT